jgi:hypothetical protein
MIAARGMDVVTVDAKARLHSTDTGRYAVSRTSLTAGLQFLGVHAPVPLYYVLGDLGVLTPAEVMHYGSTAFRYPRRVLLPDQRTSSPRIR